MSETVGICNGVGENDAVSTFVKRFGNISKSLLSGSVPDVESDLASIQFDSLDFEIYTDCAEIIGLEGVLAITN